MTHPELQEPMQSTPNGAIERVNAVRRALEFHRHKRQKARNDAEWDHYWEATHALEASLADLRTACAQWCAPWFTLTPKEATQ